MTLGKYQEEWMFCLRFQKLHQVVKEGFGTGGKTEVDDEGGRR